jgi:hypothetical protein
MPLGEFDKRVVSALGEVAQPSTAKIVEIARSSLSPHANLLFFCAIGSAVDICERSTERRKTL